jgi:hypothetical protein
MVAIHVGIKIACSFTNFPIKLNTFNVMNYLWNYSIINEHRSPQVCVGC